MAKSLPVSLFSTRLRTLSACLFNERRSLSPIIALTMEPRARLSSISGLSKPAGGFRCFRSDFFLGCAFQPLLPPRCLFCEDVFVFPSSFCSSSSSSSSVSEVSDSSESPSPGDDPVVPLPDVLLLRLLLVSNSLQLIRGSYTNASNTAMTLSLLSRSTRITASDVNRNIPSMPHTSIAFTNMRVSRKGIFSGNFSRCMATSKQSPKSM
mmetsp:Transcript_13524/g.18717  ORF Transcript_13524/g.18717 Transcript_13524/m.18717 type:complete len:209 (+) Transcript_13524:401-1027(+)